MLLKFILLITAVAVICAEPPVRAPYAPAGWRPRVPFNLPEGSSLEISRERVEHAGTFNEPQRNSNYLPPKFDVPDQQQQPVPSVGQDDISIRGRQTIQQPRPAEQYGAPADDTFRINYPDEDDSAPATDLQQNVQEGRYYIVSSDNKLQRVVYRTVQSAKDSADDGFTAQLKYSSVGELQDPVYKYNSQGQLERVLK